MPIRVEQHVIRLDVAMHDILPMDITQSATQLGHPEANRLFGEGFSRDVEAQIAACHQIDDNVQVFDVLETVAEIAEKGVIEVFQHTSFSYHVAHAFTAHHC